MQQLIRILLSPQNSLIKKIGFKEDEIGLTKDTAYEILLSGHPYSLYEGLTGTGTDERWYKFNVADKAVIDPSFPPC